MSFLSPAWLAALAAPLVIAVAYAVAQRRRSGYAVAFADVELLDEVAPEQPRWRRHLPALGWILALVALVLGLARPAVARTVPEERATVILALDVSLSMASEDVDPTRFAVAQEAADTFLDRLPEGIRVGLVAFAGQAQPLVAPTVEREAVEAAIDNLRLGEGTGIGEAVFVSLGLIDTERTLAEGEDGGDVPASIVVLSDGETTMGRPDAEAVAAALDAEVPVNTIAFGTDAGTVTLPDGQVVPVPVNEVALRRIADDAGGVFFEALTADELEEAFGDLGSSVGQAEEDREIDTVFLATALALGSLAAAASVAWFARLP